MFTKLLSWSSETVDKIEDRQIRDIARAALPVAQMLFMLLVLSSVLGFLGGLVKAFVSVATYMPK